MRPLATKTFAALILGLTLFSQNIAVAAAAGDDLYCFGSRYKLGQPFVDRSKLRPRQLTILGSDPVVHIDRLQRRVDGGAQTFGYAYYNKKGLAVIGAAPDIDTTTEDKEAFLSLLSRLNIKPIARLSPGSKDGDGVILFWAGTALPSVLDANTKLEKCMPIAKRG